MLEDIRKNVVRGNIWVRLIYMIVLGVAFNVAEFVILVTAVFQFLASLITGEPNQRLISFGRNTARYAQQIIAFVTFASEDRPFPFSSWPSEPHDEAAPATAASAAGDTVTQAAAIAPKAAAAKPKRPPARKAAAAPKAAAASKTAATKKAPAARKPPAPKK